MFDWTPLGFSADLILATVAFKALQAWQMKKMKEAWRAAGYKVVARENRDRRFMVPFSLIILIFSILITPIGNRMLIVPSLINSLLTLAIFLYWKWQPTTVTTSLFQPSE